MTDAAQTSPRRGRRPAAGTGDQVVATSSLVLWQVLLTDAYARLGFDKLAGPWSWPGSSNRLGRHERVCESQEVEQSQEGRGLDGAGDVVACK